MRNLGKVLPCSALTGPDACTAPCVGQRIPFVDAKFLRRQSEQGCTLDDDRHRLGTSDFWCPHSREGCCWRGDRQTHHRHGWRYRRGVRKRTLPTPKRNHDDGGKHHEHKRGNAEPAEPVRVFYRPAKDAGALVGKKLVTGLGRQLTVEVIG